MVMSESSLGLLFVIGGRQFGACVCHWRPAGLDPHMLLVDRDKSGDKIEVGLLRCFGVQHHRQSVAMKSKFSLHGY